MLSLLPFVETGVPRVRWRSDFQSIRGIYQRTVRPKFRYHAIRDDAYVKHLLEAHRVYLKRVVGNDRWYRELSGIYLTAVGLHDKHDKKVVRLGKDLMGLYYGIMFREKYGSNGN